MVYALQMTSVPHAQGGLDSPPGWARDSRVDERRRLLALLEVYDTAIEELYVLRDRRFIDLILRLERRRRDVAARLANPGEVSGQAMPEPAPITPAPTQL